MERDRSGLGAVCVGTFADRDKHPAWAQGEWGLPPPQPGPGRPLDGAGAGGTHGTHGTQPPAAARDAE